MPEKDESPSEPADRPAAKSRKRDPIAEASTRREAALDLAALQFKALGDPTRLRILRLLSGDVPATVGETGPPSDAAPPADGWTVGDVSLGLFGKAKVSSTLSHHLKELRNAGLITMKRRGKNLICRVQAEALVTLRCQLVVARENDARSLSAKPRPGKTRGKERAGADDSRDRTDDPPSV